MPRFRILRDDEDGSHADRVCNVPCHVIQYEIRRKHHGPGVERWADVVHVLGGDLELTKKVLAVLRASTINPQWVGGAKPKGYKEPTNGT